MLLDFGLVTDTAPRRPTPDDSLLGTVGYMAPEQARLGRVGAKADWYAVGVLLYFALCGRLPFEGTATEILMRKQRESPAAAERRRAVASPRISTRCASTCCASSPTPVRAATTSCARLAMHGERSRASWTPPSTGRASFVGRRRGARAPRARPSPTARAGAMVVVRDRRRVGRRQDGARAALRRRGRRPTDALVLVGPLLRARARPVQGGRRRRRRPHATTSSRPARRDRRVAPARLRGRSCRSSSRSSAASRRSPTRTRPIAARSSPVRLAPGPSRRCASCSAASRGRSRSSSRSTTSSGPTPTA